MIPFFEGFLLGFFFIWQFGPGFFLLVETSLQRGLKQSFWVAVGISINDFVIVLLVALGYIELIDDAISRWLGLFGGSLLIIYGIATFVKKSSVSSGEALKESSDFLYCFKGFMINGLNPSVTLFWVGMVALINEQQGHQSSDLIYSASGMVFIIFLSDLLKAGLAFRLKNLMTPLVIKRVNQVSGIALTIFGIAIIIQVILEL